MRIVELGAEQQDAVALESLPVFRLGDFDRRRVVTGMLFFTRSRSGGGGKMLSWRLVPFDTLRPTHSRHPSFAPIVG
jgi:hypothetical protein